MVSVPTSLGEWIHSPWFDLGLVVWKGYRPRVRLVLAGGHASAWFSPFWRGPAPGAQRYQAETTAECRPKGVILVSEAFTEINAGLVIVLASGHKSPVPITVLEDSDTDPDELAHVITSAYHRHSPGGGCGPPRGMCLRGGGGPVRVRGDVKLRYSAGELLKAPVPNEP